jgi:hypothetical protein
MRGPPARLDPVITILVLIDLNDICGDIGVQVTSPI